MESAIDWGTVPPALLAALTTLAKKAKKDAEHLGRIRWPEGPADVQDELRAAISDAHKISKAGTELRAVLSAYAHRVHEPRPVISDLARAQDTGSQGFIRRYSDATLAAVQQLVSDSPDIETVRAGIPSLSLYDLRDLGGAVGDAAQRRIAADEGVRGDL